VENYTKRENCVDAFGLEIPDLPIKINILRKFEKYPEHLP
jgi:hypothetical protein